MFALAKGDADVVRDVLNKFGYKNSADVKKTEYDKVCSTIEEMVRKKEQKEQHQAEQEQEEAETMMTEQIPLPWEEEAE